MAQGRSTKIISMIQWIRTSRLSIKKSLPEAGSDSEESTREEEGGSESDIDDDLLAELRVS